MSRFVIGFSMIVLFLHVVDSTNFYEDDLLQELEAPTSPLLSSLAIYKRKLQNLGFYPIVVSTDNTRSDRYEYAYMVQNSRRDYDDNYDVDDYERDYDERLQELMLRSGEYHRPIANQRQNNRRKPNQHHRSHKNHSKPPRPSASYSSDTDNYHRSSDDYNRFLEDSMRAALKAAALNNAKDFATQDNTNVQAEEITNNPYNWMIEHKLHEEKQPSEMSSEEYNRMLEDKIRSLLMKAKLEREAQKRQKQIINDVMTDVEKSLSNVEAHSETIAIETAPTTYESGILFKVIQRPSNIEELSERTVVQAVPMHNTIMANRRFDYNDMQHEVTNEAKITKVKTGERDAFENNYFKTTSYGGIPEAGHNNHGKKQLQNSPDILIQEISSDLPKPKNLLTVISDLVSKASGLSSAVDHLTPTPSSFKTTTTTTTTTPSSPIDLPDYGMFDTWLTPEAMEFSNDDDYGFEPVKYDLSDVGKFLDSYSQSHRVYEETPEDQELEVLFPQSLRDEINANADNNDDKDDDDDIEEIEISTTYQLKGLPAFSTIRQVNQDDLKNLEVTTYKRIITPSADGLDDDIEEVQFKTIYQPVTFEVPQHIAETLTKSALNDTTEMYVMPESDEFQETAVFNTDLPVQHSDAKELQKKFNDDFTEEYFTEEIGMVHTVHEQTTNSKDDSITKTTTTVKTNSQDNVPVGSELLFPDIKQRYDALSSNRAPDTIIPIESDLIFPIHNGVSPHQGEEEGLPQKIFPDIKQRYEEATLNGLHKIIPIDSDLIFPSVLNHLEDELNAPILFPDIQQRQESIVQHSDMIVPTDEIQSADKLHPFLFPDIRQRYEQTARDPAMIFPATSDRPFPNDGNKLFDLLFNPQEPILFPDIKQRYDEATASGTHNVVSVTSDLIFPSILNEKHQQTGPELTTFKENDEFSPNLETVKPSQEFINKPNNQNDSATSDSPVIPVDSIKLSPPAESNHRVIAENDIRDHTTLKSLPVKFELRPDLRTEFQPEYPVYTPFESGRNINDNHVDEAPPTQPPPQRSDATIIVDGEYADIYEEPIIAPPNKPLQEITINEMSELNQLKLIPLIPILIEQLRMDRVTPEEKTILQQIFGNEFWQLILAEVEANTSVAEMNDTLQKIMNAQNLLDAAATVTQSTNNRRRKRNPTFGRNNSLRRRAHILRELQLDHLLNRGRQYEADIRRGGYGNPYNF